MARRYRAALGRDDVLSLAHLGLVQAAATYDPRHGVPFEAFARRRILGAIVDGYRRELPRAADRLAACAVERARSGRRRDRRSDPERIDAALASLAAAWFAAYTSAAASGAEAGLEARSRIRFASAALARALAELPPADRALVELRYEDGREVAAIAAARGTTARTVRRQHAAVLARLRAAMRRAGVEAWEVVG